MSKNLIEKDISCKHKFISLNDEPSYEKGTLWCKQCGTVEKWICNGGDSMEEHTIVRIVPEIFKGMDVYIKEGI
jgi:hypothetical protein